MTGLITRTDPAVMVMALGIHLMLTSSLAQISQGANASRPRTRNSEEPVDKQNRAFTNASEEMDENIELSNCESLHIQKVLEVVLSPEKEKCDDPVRNNIASDHPLTEEKHNKMFSNDEIVEAHRKGILLHFLAEANKTGAVRALLLLGASASKEDHRGDTPLHYAVRGRAYDVMQLLLKAGADAKAKGADKLTPLDSAAERDDTQAVHILIREGSPFTSDIANAFKRAINIRDYNSLKTLIEGVGVLPNRILKIALEEAIRKEDREAIRLLIAAEVEVVEVTEEGDDERQGEGTACPLSEATARGREDILKTLLGAWGYTHERTHCRQSRTPLMAAAHSNNPRSVEMLAEAGAHLEDVDHGRQTALFYAANADGREALPALLDLGANVNATDNIGENALHKAVRNSPGAVTVLLQAGIDKEARNNEGRTPVFAGTGQSSDAFRLLLNANVSLNTRDNYNRTPLLHHAFSGDEKGISLLLGWSPDLEERDDSGNTALHLAAIHAASSRHNYPIDDHTELLNPVRSLVAAGADVDAQDEEGVSPLLWLVDAGFDAGAELLLRAGADKDIRDARGYTPLHSSAQKGYVSRALLQFDPDVNARDRRGCTPLMVAAASGSSHALRLLAAAGAAVHARDESGRTALHWAAKAEAGSVRALLQSGADINATDMWGRSPLHWARGSGATVQELVSAGAHKDARDASGATPLHLLVYERCESCVRELLLADADTNISDERGVTPAMCAVEQMDVKILKLLFKAGADLDARDKEGSTALHRATVNGSVNALRSLLEMGVAVDAKDNNGKTPLHLASERNNMKALQALLAAGAEVNLPDGAGRTALHWAARRGGERAVKRLVQAGADVNAQDNEQRTPLWDAVFSDDVSSAALLVGAGADVNHVAQGRTPYDLAKEKSNEIVWRRILYGFKFNG